MLYIGSRIQEYRKKAELSQEEFADKIGVKQTGSVQMGER